MVGSTVRVKAWDAVYGAALDVYSDFDLLFFSFFFVSFFARLASTNTTSAVHSLWSILRCRLDGSC